MTKSVYELLPAMKENYILLLQRLIICVICVASNILQCRLHTNSADYLEFGNKLPDRVPSGGSASETETQIAIFSKHGGYSCISRASDINNISQCGAILLCIVEICNGRWSINCSTRSCKQLIAIKIARVRAL